MLRPLLLGCAQALHGLHAPLLHALPLPPAMHATYLQHYGLLHIMAGAIFSAKAIVPQWVLRALFAQRSRVTLKEN